MLRFIRGRGPHVSSERLKHHKDVFTFQKTVPHGFPHHPTALAYDEDLQLLALTTKKGQLRVYGQPGVEYCTDIDSDSPVCLIQFIPDKRGEIILLHDDGTIQHFEINLKEATNEPTLDKVKCTNHFERNEEDSSKHATTLTAVSSPSSVDGKKVITIYVGTQSGNVYLLDLDTFNVSTDIIQQSAVLANVPADVKKSSQGSVEVIAPQPHTSGGKLLIGYQRGLLVLWSVESSSCEKFYNSSQQLQSASWQSQGKEFITSHNDGSYIIWNESDNSNAREGTKTPYGPFPCKPITKILRKTTKDGDDYLFLSGGMPRASHSEKLTVSIIQGDSEGTNRHHVLDFTSRVIDFVTIDNPSDGKDNPIALIVLLDEEIVAIDLTTPDWLQFKLPYLSSVHSSGIICCQHYSNLPEDVIGRIYDAGAKQDEGKYSSNSWPIVGGVLFNSKVSPAVNELVSSSLDDEQQQQPSEVTSENNACEAVASNDDDDMDKVNETKNESSESHECSAAPASNQSRGSKKDILVTGHEDGSICFWDATKVNLSHILTVHTRKLFIAPDCDIAPIDGDDIPGESMDDEWPPFRKVGTFDPYSDDGRLAIQRVTLCPVTGSFIAAGTAGQVIVMSICPESKEADLSVVSTNLVEEASGFTWKGHDQLYVKNGAVKLDPGYQPEIIVQITPPAAVTALSINSEWGLLAAGTAHGFVVFDTLLNKVLLTKTTLNLADLTATSGGDVLISRRKSFKKSLRESFRRLRKGRSMRSKKSTSPSTDPSSASSSKVTSPVRSLASAALDDDTRPVERQIEAKQDDGLGSMVRTLYFALSPITSHSASQASLWVGTNAGTVFLYSITLPAEEKRQSDAVTVQLAKEIQLKHRAPVIFIQVVDSAGYPIAGAHELAKGKAKAPASAASQRVLIVSEEQFKLFTLPSLKPERKTKLTAHEGSRVRKVAIAHFTSKLDDKFTEHCMVCLSNQGEVAIYSIGDLKRLRNQAITKRDDVHGMASLVFTSDGEGFYLHTPSEFMRFTMSSNKVINASGYVVIPENARPARQEEETQSQQQNQDNLQSAVAPVVETPLTVTSSAQVSTHAHISESCNRNVTLEKVVEEEDIEDEPVNCKSESNCIDAHHIDSSVCEPNHSTPVTSEIDVSSLVRPLESTLSPIKVPDANGDSVTLSDAATTAVNASNVVTLEPEDMEPMSLTTVSEVESTPSFPVPDESGSNSTVVTHEKIHSESVTNGKVNSGHSRKGPGKNKSPRARAKAAAAAAAAAAMDSSASVDNGQTQNGVSNGSGSLVHSPTGNGHEADDSNVTSDITIDSVKDFTNLSISDAKQQNLLSEQKRPDSGLKDDQRPGSGLKGEKPKTTATPPPIQDDEQQVDDQLMELLVDNFQ